MDNLKVTFIVVGDKRDQSNAQVGPFQALRSPPPLQHSEAMNDILVNQGHSFQVPDNELQQALQFLNTDLANPISSVQPSSPNLNEMSSPKLILSPKRFICPYLNCDQSFARSEQLTWHKHYHNDRKPYHCKWPACQFASVRMFDIIAHIRRKHLQVPLTMVEQERLGMTIDKGYNVPDYIEVDQAAVKVDISPTVVHSSKSTKLAPQPKPPKPSPKRFICPHAGCNRSFTQKNGLMSHKRTSHGGIKPYYCKWPACQYSSVRKVDIKCHIRRKHFRVPITKVEQVRRGMAIDIGHNVNHYIEVDQTALDMEL